MGNLYRISLIILHLAAVVNFLQSQEWDLDSIRPNLKKNIIHVSFSHIGIYAASIGSYERMIVRSFNRKESLWIRIGGGVWVDVIPEGGPLLLIGGVFLSGANNNFFELNFGMTYMFDKMSYNSHMAEYEYALNNPDAVQYSKPSVSSFDYYRPAGSIGYRYQKRGGILLIRAGFGYPESAYLGLGICF